MKTLFHPAGHLVIGLSGNTLTSNEQHWIMEHKPAGVILFSRNLGTLDEVVALIHAIRAASNPPPTLWLDQEGGRVQRLRAPLTRYPTAETLGQAYERNPARGIQLAHQWGHLCGRELSALGFGVNCAPVLDLREAGAHPVIGDRAWGQHPEQVVRLADAWLDGLATSGCMAVGKHFPGHGAAMVDSHRHLPVIEKDREELESRELLPFRQLAPKLPAMMTAHLIAKALDAHQPATWSPEIMTRLLRHQWGYQGLLVSDAIEMAALDGDLQTRTQRAIQAGCDLVLCCTGSMADNEAARLGVLAAWETRLSQPNRGPKYNTEEIGSLLDSYRIAPGDWRKLLSDPDYQYQRQQLEALSNAPLGADPTCGTSTIS
ncbi:MAG: beta-N-acetylhexosaminidase [Magnetococcales bacterium]|nr:beta-N-acetylhexosaminidase [Magnetococcales bacterium]MBF0151288.1 beta-N-acetylhexosaminidase [Magnetococcales bacterium]